MRHRLRPGLRSAWRGPGTLQLGLGGRESLVLSGVTDLDLEFLGLLAVGVAQDAVRAGRVAPGPARCAELLAHLGEAGLLLTAEARSGSAGFTPAERRRLDGDAVAWSWAAGGAPGPVSDGWDVLAGRRRSRVHVRGLGRTGWAIATTLRTCGVAVTVEDARPVVESDLVPGGPAADDLGTAREAAFSRAEPVPPPRAGATGTRRPAPFPDLVVLVDAAVADTPRADDLVSADVPHLSVVIGEAQAVVGPLVVPGATPCLRCLDLHRTDRDPAWPAVLAQLSLPSSSAPVDTAAPTEPEETLLSAATAALAAAQVLAGLDGRSAPTLGATLELDLPDLLPARRPWVVHPACGCCGLGARSPGSGPTIRPSTATMDA